MTAILLYLNTQKRQLCSSPRYTWNRQRRNILLGQTHSNFPQSRGGGEGRENSWDRAGMNISTYSLTPVDQTELGGLLPQNLIAGESGVGATHSRPWWYSPDTPYTFFYTAIAAPKNDKMKYTEFFCTGSFSGSSLIQTRTRVLVCLSLISSRIY